MGKIMKNKDVIKIAKTEISKVSRKTTLKPKTPVKAKKLIVEKSKVLEKGVNKKVKTTCAVNIEQFKKGIEALLQYEERKSSKDLFTQEEAIFLQIEAIKIPICPNRRIRFQLKNTLLTDKQEICLIVPDLQKGRNIDHEPTIEHYEELLRSKNVKTIKRILPIRQLRVEYDQFELKRRLCGYYDFFLVSGNISGHALHLLGKTFIKNRKIPIPIKLDSGNLGENIENALKKATLNIHPKGATFIVQFGHSEMSSEQLTENLKTIADKLVTEFPGGWANIRALRIKTKRSISIPVYYTLKSFNKVNVPVIKSIRPKKYEKVTDEISTKEFGSSEITVHPGGKVEFKKNRKLKTTKNQLRKIKQGRIHKESQKLQVKRNKLKRKVKKDQIKPLVKIADLATIKKIKVTSEVAKAAIKKQKRKRVKKENTEETKKQMKEKQVKIVVKNENLTQKIKQEKVQIKPEGAEVTVKKQNRKKGKQQQVKVKSENLTQKIKQEKIQIKSEGIKITAEKQKKKKAKKQNTAVIKENDLPGPKQLKEKHMKVEAKQIKLQAKKQKKTKANKENNHSPTLVKTIEISKQKKTGKPLNKTVEEQILKTQKNKKIKIPKKDIINDV